MKRSLFFSRLLLPILFSGFDLILNGQSVIFSENFSGFTTGSHASPSTVDISGTLDQRTQVPGWTGLKIYSAGGGIKIGTSDITGWIETPLIDFSGHENAIMVKFDVARWPGDASNVTVSLNGTVLINSIIPVDEFKTYEVSVDFGTTSGRIKFESLSKRFFLDNIMVFTKNITSVEIPEEELNQVRIYPNPTRDIITFSKLALYSSVEISDINGIVHKMIRTFGTDLLEVSLADLKPGFYFAKFVSDKGFRINMIIKYN